MWLGRFAVTACQAKEQWLEIQDLFVEERSPQMIFLSESYIQIWERKDVAGTLVL